MRVLSLAVGALCGLGALAKHAVLTDDNFSNEVGVGTPAIVEFYAPWCGHCKALAPEWEILEKAVEKSSAVLVAKVDATENRGVAGKYGVSGYPTIKWFSGDSAEDPEDYNGGRTAADIAQFITTQTGAKIKLPGVADEAVVALNERNFDENIFDGKRHAIVEFYAPWCGHCKQLAPVYEKVAQAFQGEENVLIAKVDATAASDLASTYGVTGYPTLKYFSADAAGEDDVQDYNSGRSEEAFIKFVNEKAGTERTVGGGFTESAGRVQEFDSLAAKFADADEADYGEIISQTQTLVEDYEGKNADVVKFYAKAMTKSIKAGSIDAYVTKEAARLARMLESSSVAPSKRSFFARRRNILRAFADIDDAKDEL